MFPEVQGVEEGVQRFQEPEPCRGRDLSPVLPRREPLWQQAGPPWGQELVGWAEP